MSEGFKVTLPRPTAASRARARALLTDPVYSIGLSTRLPFCMFPQNWPLARDFQRA